MNQFFKESLLIFLPENTSYSKYSDWYQKTNPIHILELAKSQYFEAEVLSDKNRRLRPSTVDGLKRAVLKMIISIINHFIFFGIKAREKRKDKLSFISDSPPT